MSLETSRQPDLSSMPTVNCFEVHENFRAVHPMAQAMDRLGAGREARTYARVDLELPMGCPFSIFLVRGYPKDEEITALGGSLCVSRELAQALAEQLDDASILEFPVHPRKEHLSP